MIARWTAPIAICLYTLHMNVVDERDTRHDDRFRALANPSRRRLLHLVRDESRAVGALADDLGISQPAVSQHLGILRNAGLVTVDVDGPRRLYRVDPVAIDDVRAWFDAYWAASLDRLAVAAEHAAGSRRS